MYRSAEGMEFGDWDGHSHGQFCLHGSGEETGEMIERAAALGFERFSLTEHAPAPPDFEDPAPHVGASLAAERLEAYLDHAEALRERFADRIEVAVGLEVDYLQGLEGGTRDILKRAGPRLDDALLSVHFLPSRGGWMVTDLSPHGFREGLVEAFGGLEGAHAAYWSTVLRAVEADLGPHKPRRLAHLTLAHKFRREVGEPSLDFTLAQAEPVLVAMAERGMALDVNAARLDFAPCGDLMPPAPILERARQLSIELVYGSDAHAVAHVGRGLEEARRVVGTL